MIDLVKKEPEVNTECRMKKGEKQSESVIESVDNRATQGAFFVCVCVLALRQHTNQSREYQTRILNIPLSPPSADAHSQVCSVASVAAVMTTSTPVPGYNTHPSVSIMNSIKG